MRRTGKPFPQDPFEQLRKIICAVFASQNLERVKLFKKSNLMNIDNAASLMIMPMIFGNRSITTSSIVLATRNLVDGSSDINGEFATNATCRDIVKKQRDPLPLDNLSKENSDLFHKITNIAKTLEKHFRKPQIIDFTYENGEVYVMESVNAQLTAPGRFRAAKEMVDAGLIEKEESLRCFEPDDVAQLLAPRLAGSEPTPFCKGIPSGNACVVGKVCLTNEDAIQTAKKGESPILFKKLFASTDFEAMMVSSAVVTAIGSNYSLVSDLTRLFRKTAAIGCDGLVIDLENNCIKNGSTTINAGDLVTITGTGSVLEGAQELMNPQSQEDEFAKEVLSWADEIRKDKINVFTLATNADEVKFAVDIGSDGVGSLSLEQFFDGEDKRYILDICDPSNEDGVSAFENYLTGKLKELFSAAGSKTITIRLFDKELTSYMDPPLELAKEIGILRAQKDRDGNDFASQDELDAKIAELENLKKARKANPSFGCRSIRLLISRPELMNAEIRSILNAAKEARGSGGDPQTRILIPFASDYRELSYFAKKFEEISLEIGEKAKIGIEIDTPRACLTAGKLAEVTDFMNLVVSELAESVYSFDRKEGESNILPFYKDNNFMEDIFDENVNKIVSDFMKMCTTEAKQTKADGEFAIFNKDFNDPKVIDHYKEYNINSFICTPPAVPIARLCAAKSLLAKQ